MLATSCRSANRKDSCRPSPHRESGRTNRTCAAIRESRPFRPYVSHAPRPLEGAVAEHPDVEGSQYQPPIRACQCANPRRGEICKRPSPRTTSARVRGHVLQPSGQTTSATSKQTPGPEADAGLTRPLKRPLALPSLPSTTVPGARFKLIAIPFPMRLWFRRPTPTPAYQRPAWH